MYNILLRNFILENPDWETTLTKPPYSLKISRDNGYIMFKYNQLESDFNIPLVREARGIIFDEQTWDCVCHAFNKFGNYGETYCPEIDWSTAIVSEKVDGSLIKLWYHNKKWHLSTNGTIDAKKAQIGDNITGLSFYDLFCRAIDYMYHCTFTEFVKNLNKNFTYMFELVSPLNRVVIPYQETKIFLLCMRDMTTGEEISMDILPHYNICPSPKIYKLNTLDAVVACANELPWNEEGYVVCDGNFNRIKIKSPQYVIAHYARTSGTMTIKRFVEIILQNQMDEFLIYAEDYKDKLLDIQKAMDGIIKTCNWFTDKAQDTKFENRKEYALYVKKLPDYAQAFMFKWYDNHQSFEEYSKNLTTEQWVRLLEKYYGEENNGTQT